MGRKYYAACYVRKPQAHKSLIFKKKKKKIKWIESHPFSVKRRPMSLIIKFAFDSNFYH